MNFSIVVEILMSHSEEDAKEIIVMIDSEEDAKEMNVMIDAEKGNVFHVAAAHVNVDVNVETMEMISL